MAGSWERPARHSRKTSGGARGKGGEGGAMARGKQELRNGERAVGNAD